MKYVQNTYYGHSWIQCKGVCCGSISGLHKTNDAGITVTTTLVAYIYFKLNRTAPCPIKLCNVTDMYSENFQTEQDKYCFYPSIRLYLGKGITFLIYSLSINKLWCKNGKGWETEHFISPLPVNIYQFKNNMLQIKSVFLFYSYYKQRSKCCFCIYKNQHSSYRPSRIQRGAKFIWTCVIFPSNLTVHKMLQRPSSRDYYSRIYKYYTTNRTTYLYF